MKLARVGAAGQEIPVVGDAQGRWYDLRSVVGTMDGAVFGRTAEIAGALAAGELPALEEPVRFGPPLPAERIGKIVCIGLNYHEHARETGATPPSEPVMFLKVPDTVVGAEDEVLVPRRSTKTDYEVELAVVIGAQARYLRSEADAAAVIGGYAISNDVSERDFQLERAGQWDKGKNCETFNPLGPWIVTADEIPDPQALTLRTWINGELRQHGSTADMIFGVHHLVWYLSQFLVLRAGDVINTGTPAGVALGSDAIPYLRAGDVVELEITGLGRQRQKIGQA